MNPYNISLRKVYLLNVLFTFYSLFFMKLSHELVFFSFLLLQDIVTFYLSFQIKNKFDRKLVTNSTCNFPIFEKV